ncbi:MAG TPA: hypothetical protein VFW34_08930 [Candidatus Rubrimentiphilum sp.]|nr:hypothetical protein [Candidatus Rubrimentiphilum sp.]
MKGTIRIASAVALALAIFSGTVFHASAQAGTIVVTAQVLDYQNGYVFITTGDGFRVSPNLTIVTYNTTKATGPPQPRQFARITFDQTGVVIKIETSNSKIAPEGDLAAVRHFAVALTPSIPNPDLGQTKSDSSCANVRPGKSVLLNITVQVPPTTPLTDNVYMTTDQSGWNAQAYRMDRVDALHYRTQMKLLSGTVLRVLFDRGSMQSIQVGQDGIEQQPYSICIGDEDVHPFTKTVYHWADQQAGASLPIPQTFPTPYNPAPFPNLPTPQPRPSSVP